MISKTAVQIGLGIIAMGGMVGGGVSYLLSDNTEEYLAEVTWENKTDSYIRRNNFDRRQQSLSPDEIKGGNEKNYFCQWIDKELQTDNKCKLIELDFSNDKKSLNLTQISSMNNEISKSWRYFPFTWFKLKISKNYEFKINQPTKIKIAEIGKNNKIVTTIVPKFKISTLPIQGNSDWFLMKLNEWNPINLNIFNKQSYKCSWITKEKANEIVSSVKTSSSITTITNLESKYCNIDEFVSDKQNQTPNRKTTELDSIQSSTKLPSKSQITEVKKGDYFIINSEEEKNNLITKSSSNLLIMFDENITQDKNISFAIFTLESLLVVNFNGADNRNADLIILN